MAFGKKLNLEGRSPGTPEWGVFKTVMIAAETSHETSDSATERVRRYLEKQAAMWQNNYDSELQFRIAEVSRATSTVRERSISQALSQPLVASLGVKPESITAAYPRRQRPKAAPTSKPLMPLPRSNTSYSATDRRHA